MSSQTSPLSGADNAASDRAGSSRRPYRAPELRELGAVAELTQGGGPPYDGSDSPTYGIS